MLRDILKEKTHAAHQKAEGTIIRRIKKIRTEEDYIDVLKGFYVYFSLVEEKMANYITEDVLPDLKERRDSSYIQADIMELGGSIEDLPEAVAPEMNTLVDALSAMYVLEGSIMGGPHIVRMLEKQGINKGFSFFNGYGSKSGPMFGKFAAVLNKHGEKLEDHSQAVAVANETFNNFGEVFTSSVLN